MLQDLPSNKPTQQHVEQRPWLSLTTRRLADLSISSFFSICQFYIEQFLIFAGRFLCGLPTPANTGRLSPFQASQSDHSCQGYF